ncbi:MAG: hypothetical protein AAF974_01925 [Cyanobacteria bacterium P01_E01_bin.34]
MKNTQTWLSGAVGLLLLTSGAMGAPVVLAQDGPNTGDELAPGGSQSLFEVTDTVSGLLEPLDLATETERALQGAGRSDPFRPVNQVAPSSIPDPFIEPATVGDLPDLPAIDPAEFARSVRITGIVQVGNETFALVESPSSVADVIEEGGMYESVKVASISVNTGEVVLQEGGETVVAIVE